MYKKIFKLKVNNKIFYLKPLKQTYVNQNYLSWFSDKDVKDNIVFKPRSINDLKTNVINFLKDKNTFFFYSIFFKKNHIGNVKIDNVNKENNSAYLGILIGNKNYRGIGLGQEVIKFIKGLCIENSIYNIYLGCCKKNIKALNLYLKLDFKIIKNLKKSYILLYNYVPSKLILGLAQFNSTYGITNFKKIKLSKNTQNKILRASFLNGIKTVDTSENYLFDVNKNLKLLKNFFINTKISSSSRFLSYKNVKNIIGKYKKNKLNLNTVFIHDGDNLFTKKGLSILKILKRLKKEMLINNIGISIYNFEILKKIDKSTGVDIVQVPYNLIDTRLKIYEKKLSSLSIKIQVRSIFLQGSMLKKVKNNKNLSKMYDKLIAYSRKLNENLFQMCINHCMSNTNIDQIVVGVRSLNELNMLFNNKIRKKKYNFRISNALKKKIINPSLWS
jgi:aryl-alcohol dehydrogenase-like predicted oxidoreductase/RimJ/RimL family protein N-acetyltransferase